MRFTAIPGECGGYANGGIPVPSRGVSMSASGLPLAVTYLREEPDALMSARPGPRGGRSATIVPTAIGNDTELPDVILFSCFLANRTRVVS
jgi:hypothetical protein